MTLNQQVLDAIRQGLIEEYFTGYDQDFLRTDAGLADIEAHVRGRYESAMNFVIPWVRRFVDLTGKTIVEIGSGTGSSGVAFAEFTAKVHGYEIAEGSIRAARRRAQAMGLSNVDFHLVAPEAMLGTFLAQHSGGCDVVLLFAVLEHLTIAERQQYLQGLWSALKPGGHLVIVECPNRFCLWDYHTGQMPFLHLLPPELALQYLDRSPRDGFVNSMKETVRLGHDTHLALTRWGLGASFHEFEVALGADYLQHLVADGTEPEITPWFPGGLEEDLLTRYFKERPIDRPLGFAKSVLNVIFRR